MNIQLTVSIIKEGKQYIAYTPALDLSTCGKSKKEAEKLFGEAVDIFFQELIQKGTLEKVLADLGWKKVKTQWAPPEIISTDMQKFCVAI
jgi:predicted RNase H-like HicB family nuclease